MKFTGSVAGSGGVAASGGGTLPPIDDMRVVLLGDSTVNYVFSLPNAESNLVSEANNYFDSTTVYDVANGGSHLYKTIAQEDNGSETNYWYDDTTDSLSTRFTSTEASEAALAADPTLPNMAYLSIGANDSNTSTEAAVATYTVAAYKAELKEYCAAVKARYTNVRYIIISPVCRRDAGEDRENIRNNIRQATLEAIDEVSYLVRGPDRYDMERFDEEHLTTAEREGEATRRIAYALAYYGGKAVTQGEALGPSVSSAAFLLDRVRVTVSPGAGSDITVGTAVEEYISPVIGGSEVVCTDAQKIDSTTFDMFLPEGREGETASGDLWVGFGQMEGLNQVSSTEVVIDNATNPMPLQQSITNISAETDVFQNLTDLHTYFGARPSAKTYSSSTNVSQIDGLFSSANCVTDAGREPNYDSALFGGAGGLESNDVTTHLESASTAIDFSGGCSFYIVFKSPASLTAEVPVFALGNQFHTGNTRSKLVISTGGVLRWGDKEDDTFLDISTIGASSTNFLAMSFNAAEDEARYSLNGGAWTTFDPFDVTAAAVSFLMFASRPTFNAVVGLEIGMCAVTTAYWDSENDPSIADMWAQADTLYSIS